MNKSDIVRGLADRNRLSVRQTEEIITQFLDTIALGLTFGDDVKLSGFGKFEVRERKPVQRRNPRTGNIVDVPAKRSLGFKPSPILKNRLNGIADETTESSTTGFAAPPDASEHPLLG